jgi:FKBP-type peptidyl-prolyl cis-trans isomerase FklB
MNPKLVIYLIMITAAVAPMAAVAQQPSPSDKPTQEAQAAAKKEPAAPAPAPAAKPEEKAVATAGGKTDQAVPPIVFQSQTDKLSYAFGINLARDLQRQKNNLNVDLLMRALTDALAGNKLNMTDEEVATTVKAFEVEQKQGQQHARMMLSERNLREGEAFFAENAKKEGVVTLPSGLQYKILKKGDGKIPTLEDVVLCNYTGKLLDGTEIDSSYKRKEPTAVPVKEVIPGWMQALQIMPVGSKWQIFVPPQLAYGDKAGGPVPPYATLIFEVELLSIQEKPKAVGALPDQQHTPSAVPKGVPK